MNGKIEKSAPPSGDMAVDRGPASEAQSGLQRKSGGDSAFAIKFAIVVALTFLAFWLLNRMVG